MAIERLGEAGVHSWVEALKRTRAANLRHRVVLDVIMERMPGSSTGDLVRRIDKGRTEQILGSLDGMRGLNLRKVIGEINQQQEKPVGGVGGLGIVGQTLLCTAARHGGNRGYSLIDVSLLLTERRVQTFTVDYRQDIQFVETDPAGSPEYELLGNLVEIPFDGQLRPVEVWRYHGYDTQDGATLSLRLRMPGVTGKPYPRFDTQENFDQMHVLGAAGLRVMRHFGILAVDDPVVDLIVGHDGHTALFKFNLYAYFREKYSDPEIALRMTRALCVETDHAPQISTMPRTTGDMVRKHYPEDLEREWGGLGYDQGRKTSALFVDMNLSKSVGVVSPVHLLVTEAEYRARQRGFADAPKLLPDNLTPDRLKIFPDTISIEDWVGMAVLYVLDKYIPEWRENPAMLDDDVLIDRMRESPDFRREIADAFDIQDQHFFGLLNTGFPRVFGEEVPREAVVFASLRRGTKYKIDMVAEFLSRIEIMEGISRGIDRPIYYLFGGLAHQSDSDAIDSIQHLLNLIELINKRGRGVHADFLMDYGIAKSAWMFAGLAKRGCWVGCTNPIQSRSQGSEAFGPSYEKSAANGVHILGPDDGGAACLSYLPTVRLYGPTTFVGVTPFGGFSFATKDDGAVSFHNDMWSNPAIRDNSRVLLVNAFYGGANYMAGRLAGHLGRFEAGRGGSAPGLGDQIESIFRAIARYNGDVIMDAYLREIS